MNSLADFKRAMQVGTKWHGYNHAFKMDFGVRECTFRNGTSFVFRTTRTDGKVVDSWLDFPKASECTFKLDGTIELWEREYLNPEREYLDNNWVIWATYKQAV